MTIFNDVQPGDLPKVLAKAVGGDAIRIVGAHPALSLWGKGYSSRIQIVGVNGATMDRTTLGKCKNMLFRTIKFQGVNPNPGALNALVTADSVSDQIGFDRCSFSTEDDVSGWSAKDWVDRPYHLGLFLRGTNMSAGSCTFRNLRNCVSLGGSNGFLTDSDFSEFGNDAIQFGGSWLRMQRNKIRGGRHSAAELLHADAGQGYPAAAGTFHSNIFIEDNDVEFVGPGDYMQGFSAFDGRWKKVYVRRNRLKAEAYHGISWYGVDGIVIEDNVLEVCPSGIVPWIQVCKDKLGKPSSDVVIRNNVTPTIRCDVADAVITGNVKLDRKTTSAVTSKVAA